VSTYLNADPILTVSSQKRGENHSNDNNENPSNSSKQQTLSDVFDYFVDDMLDHATKRGNYN